MYHEKDEQVIFIKDLIFAVLYRWRSVLAVAVAIAVLLGGYKVISGVAGNTDVQQEETQASTLELLEEDIRKQMHYLEESVLMNIDSYQVGKATATINVIAPSDASGSAAFPTSYLGAILQTYTVMLSDRIADAAVAETLEIEGKYLTELISITSEANGLNTGTIAVVVNHKEEQTAAEILACLMQTLPEITEHVQQTVADHNVTSHTFSTVQLDTDILDLQKEELTYLETLKNEYAQKKATTPPVVQNMSKKEILKGGILFAVVGGVLGVCLVAGLVWVGHFSSVKVYSARTLTAWTGVKVLCRVPGKQSKCTIDRWLRKLEGRAGEEKLPVATATIRNYSIPGQTLLVCADSGCPEDVMSALCANTPDIRLCGGLTEDVTALDAISQCEKVLLAVCCGKTKYSDVAQQAQLIRDLKKELVGCVVIDG